MANNSVTASKEHVPTWLFILLQDSCREAHDAMHFSGMMEELGRALVWTMTKKFNCYKLGVPGQTCRLFERYLANLVRIGVDANHEGLINYMTPRFLIILACCFQVAVNSISSTARVRPHDIRAYLASYGQNYTITEIMDMERDVFSGIGYHVPLYNSIQMAELLANHLNVNRDALELMGSVVYLAEYHRHKIEVEMRIIAGLHRMYNPRVRTVHLAAGCVAAAVMKADLQTSNNVEIELGRMLLVSGSYITVLRDLILVWTAYPEPPAPKPPTPKHQPNILRRKRFTANVSEPQPSTSKSTATPF